MIYYFRYYWPQHIQKAGFFVSYCKMGNFRLLWLKNCGSRSSSSKIDGFLETHGTKGNGGTEVLRKVCLKI